MQDYKDSLNLPKTDFPMKANLAQREPEWLAHWQKIDLYQQLRKQRKGQPTFILHDGPPYANGQLHIGHAINKILKDIIVKSKSMSGFDAPYVPGWDCHGLPIEHQIEKKLGKPGVKVSADEFRQACRAYAEQQVEEQRNSFIRFGVLGDWQQPYKTMQFCYEADIIRALGNIIANGHLHTGYKPVYWCLDCMSALAEAEVEYQDKTSLAVDVRFQITNSQDFYQRISMAPQADRISIPIWTTTPWTLPANQAVALNAELDYVLVKCTVAQQQECLIIAAPLLEQALARYGSTDYQTITTFCGQQLEGLLLQHPFLDRQVPVILGDHVTFDAGTGAVHTAPAHGVEDYQVGQRYQLPVKSPLGADGCFSAEIPALAGVHLAKAQAIIIELLNQQGNLLCQAQLQHSYPHCWRHKTPLIYRATQQWFVSMEQQGLREQALQAIQKVAWVPGWGQARIAGMIEQRPDWCISRQRTWGVPIALFAHKETGDLHPNTAALLEQVAKRVEQQGIEAWFAVTAEELLGTDAKHYYKLPDTLDVWFDSGVSHTAVLAKRSDLQFPADLYLEGSDQHRGWFQSALLTSVAMYKQAPYRAVLTHGFAVDAQGRKMSKSLGNVVAPDKVISQMGADVLRLWIASADYRNEITVSDEILKRAADAYRRLRNTARFLLANLHDFDPKQHQVSADQMLALDCWLVDSARLLQAELQQAYTEYQFHIIYHKLHNFCVVELGGFYLDVIKDRQYTLPANHIARRSAQTALYHVSEAMVRWFAPILSFTAEEIWQFMPGQREASVLLTTWYENLAAVSSDAVFNQSYWQQVLAVRNAVNKALEQQRQAGVIGGGLSAEVTLYCSADLYKLLALLGDELRFVLITSAAKLFKLEQQDIEALPTELTGLRLRVQPSTHNKCIRCWHHCDDVGKNTNHLELCQRCIGNISGADETRRFA